jgi:hypothetical protein
LAGGGFRLSQFFVWWWWVSFAAVLCVVVVAALDRVLILGFVQVDGGVVDIVGFGGILCDGVLAGSGF